MNNTAVTKPESDEGHRRKSVTKLIAAFLVLVAAAVGFLFLPVSTWVETLRSYVETLGFWGYIAYALSYAVMTVLLVPGSALTIAAGAFFGLVPGTLVIMVGSNLGALGAFALARTVLRSRVEEWARRNPRFEAVSNAISQNGFKIVLLLRLSPVFPFTLLNYLLGLTTVSAKQYVTANLIGMIPGTVAFVYIGSLGASLAGADVNGAEHIQLALRIVGFIATVIVTVMVTRLARRALREAEQQTSRTV